MGQMTSLIGDNAEFCLPCGPENSEGSDPPTPHSTLFIWGNGLLQRTTLLRMAQIRLTWLDTDLKILILGHIND